VPLGPVAMAVGDVYIPCGLGRVKSGGASGLHPTLRKGAKDGAPEALGLVKGGPPAGLGEQEVVWTPLMTMRPS
jgi:hypothetical protein